MPTIKTPKVIKVKVSNGSQGEYVKITNLTSGGSIVGAIGSGKDISFNSEIGGFTWAEGDTIQAEIQGRITQSTTGTISSGGVTLTLSGSASSSTAAINL